VEDMEGRLRGLGSGGLGGKEEEGGEVAIFGGLGCWSVVGFGARCTREGEIVSAV
jgi:hypothetical protein